MIEDQEGLEELHHETFGQSKKGISGKFPYTQGESTGTQPSLSDVT